MYEETLTDGATGRAFLLTLTVEDAGPGLKRLHVRALPAGTGERGTELALLAGQERPPAKCQQQVVGQQDVRPPGKGIEPGIERLDLPEKEVLRDQQKEQAQQSVETHLNLAFSNQLSATRSSMDGRRVASIRAS